MKLILSLIICLMMLIPTILFCQKTSDADRILGVWFNGEKTSKIEVFKTTSGNYAGRIVWLKVPNDENNKPKTDHKNPDAKLRTRAINGLVILSALDFKGKGKYDSGSIYDPKSGNTYSCKGELADDNTLKLRGFMGVSLLGRTDTWTRTTK